jgi:hypothetical protein
LPSKKKRPLADNHAANAAHFPNHKFFKFEIFQKKFLDQIFDFLQMERSDMQQKNQSKGGHVEHGQPRG